MARKKKTPEGAKIIPMFGKTKRTPAATLKGSKKRKEPVPAAHIDWDAEDLDPYDPRAMEMAQKLTQIEDELFRIFQSHGLTPEIAARMMTQMIAKIMYGRPHVSLFDLLTVAAFTFNWLSSGSDTDNAG